MPSALHLQHPVSTYRTVVYGKIAGVNPVISYPNMGAAVISGVGQTGDVALCTAIFMYAIVHSEMRNFVRGQGTVIAKL